MCQNKCNQGRWPCPNREACEAEERDHLSSITELAKSAVIPILLAVGAYVAIDSILYQGQPEASATIIIKTSKEN